MREYKGSEIRNIAVVGHGASGKTSLVDALAFVSGSSQAARIGEGRHRPHRSRRRRDRARVLDQPRPRLRRVAGHQDQPHRHARVPRLPGRRGRGTRGRRRRAGASSPRRTGVEVGTERMFREAVERARPGAVRRLDDGQGARGLRSHLSTDQDAPHDQGHSGRDARSARARTSTASSTSSPRRRTSSSTASRPGEYEETEIPAEAQGAVRSLLQRADRIHLRHRRHAARALPRGRRDLARRSDRRE